MSRWPIAFRSSMRMPSRAPTVGPPAPVCRAATDLRRRPGPPRPRGGGPLGARPGHPGLGTNPRTPGLADLLDLLARTVGARRAAVLSETPERRIAVSLHATEEETDAELLAAWLDTEAHRSRAERAAAGRASVMFARLHEPVVEDEPEPEPTPEQTVESIDDDELETENHGGSEGRIHRLSPEARFALIEIPSSAASSSASR